MLRLLLPSIFFAIYMSSLQMESVVGWRRPASSKCSSFDPVDVNDTWFMKFAGEGMGNPMGTKYLMNQGVGAPPQPSEDITLNHKMCMTARFKILLQRFNLQVVFKYNRINEFKAFVRTEGTPASDAFKLYGDFVMTKTDNTSYILFFGCLFEAQNFWQVHTPKGTTLSSDSRKKILTHLAAHNFSTDESDISSSKDPIWLESASISNCSGNSSPGGLSPTGDGLAVPEKPDTENVGGLEGLIQIATKLLNLKAQ